METPNTSSALTGPAASSWDALDRAARLSAAARRSTRWYSSYLVVFATGSFVLSVLTGTLQGRWGVAGTTTLWMAFLAVTTVWVARQQTAIRGIMRLHLVVMAGWTLAWLTTVLVGERLFVGQLWWWVVGGVAVALSPLVGALVARRRSA